MIKTAKMQGNVMVSAGGRHLGMGGPPWEMMMGWGAVLPSPEPPGVTAPSAARSSTSPSSQPNPPSAPGCGGPGVYLQIATLLLRGPSALGMWLVWARGAGCAR